MSKTTLGLALLLAATVFLVNDQTIQGSHLQIHSNISSESMEKTATLDMVKKDNGLQWNGQGEKTQQNYTYH